MPESSTSESERATRRQRIDPKLRAAGWAIVEHDSDADTSSLTHHAIEEFPTDNGPADYALCVDGEILGIVEAKKVSLGAQNVLSQAERYSKGAATVPANYRGYHVPLLYSTNGEVIWHHDIRHPLSRSRRIQHFHSPAALQEMVGRNEDAGFSDLRQLPNDHERLRPYQIEANTETESAIFEHKRSLLIAMATGTGKTFTMVNQAYRLMKSGVAKRVLFLVDRRALAAQAVRAFSSFEPEPGLKFDQIYEVYSQSFRRSDLGDDDSFDPKVLPTSYLENPSAGTTFVYVCTIQRMAINLFGTGTVFGGERDLEDEDSKEIDIPIHAFDLIIADECHRGYTVAEESVWRNTLNHFDAIKIGLTATPAAHTMTVFPDVAYRYEYERAVREGYLVDYEIVNISSDVRMNGIFLHEGERVLDINTATGTDRLDEIEDEREYESTQVERKITSPDSNRKILEEIRDIAAAHEERYGRFPKTLIFAVNDLPHTSHSDSLVDLARDVFGRGDSFVQKITGRVDRPLQRIREFRNRTEPGIVVTVDLLTTGVDIPDLEFIVFLRPVKSRILFEQMLGRGTRLGETFSDKSHFVVFDCFAGTLLEYFAQATGITADPPRPQTRPIADIVEDIWQNRERDHNLRRLAKRLQRIAKEMSGDAVKMFAAHIPEGDVAAFAENLSTHLEDDFVGTMAILRDEAFQDLLVDYPRPPRSFLVAYETEDTVRSEWVVRDSDGNLYRPGDYLAEFTEFVQKNPDQIDAIAVLLDRPRDWNTDSLKELREKLARTPQRFTIGNLQRAHEIRYDKALVDIISMIKHAAAESEPLLTGRERAQRAIETVTAELDLTDGQEQWLGRIGDHLAENLTIGREDFDLLPVLADAGGWNPADLVFDGELAELMKAFNEGMAA